MGYPKQENQILSLQIHGLGSGGEGVGHHNGYTIFVDGALPGEEVKARLTECRKRYGFAKLLSITKPSPDRVNPPCKLFGRCGGCQIMHLSYAKQLEIKRQKVVDALTRIGHLECEVLPCIPSPSPLAYRNKIQLPAKKTQTGISLGLYARGSHDLVEVDTCPIHCHLGESVYQIIRRLIQKSTIEGLRHVLIKSAIHTGEVLVVLVTNTKPSPPLIELAKTIFVSTSSVKGVIHNLHNGKENVILGNATEVLAGEGCIQERLCDLTFRISPASFFQVNPLQAEHLYKKALEAANLQAEDIVLDAYCGVGTLSLIFAKKASRVIGVEYVPEAIEDAKKNAAINQINNVSFVCAASEEFITSISYVDVIILNPPRKGCEPSFLEGIKKLQPKKIVYISCDPATLARDLSYLSSIGYTIDYVQPFDMFPQTSHVECIVKLTNSK